MKYFANIHSADELRKAYRAHVITMHPDRGGNEEEFKAMQAEFETLKKQYQNGTAYTYESRHTETAEERARREAEEAREREEWARWEAEEKRRREQEEREKAERIRKAQEVSRAAVRAWAGILERVAADATGQKARFYRFNDKKEAAAFVATTKRNIKAVINHYFPGLKVSVKISGEIWKEKFIISWEDGPSVQTLRDTCKELAFFLPACYHCADIGEDYGHYEEDHATAPWREAYGQALGDIDSFETVRTLSDEGKQEAEALAARYFANFDPKSDAPKFAANLQELINMAKAVGFYKDTKITNIFRQLTGNYYGDMYGVCDNITGEVSRRQLADVLAEYVAVTVTEQEKAERRAAEFRPHYGKALKSLQQLTGVGNTDKDGDAVCFFTTDRNSRRRLTIAEAVERLEQGEAVSFGTEHKGEDGRAWYWGKFAGGYKTQDKRAEKFAAAGLTIRGHVSPNSFISLHGIAPEFAAAIRADLQDIERQRKQWEQEQTAKASENRTSSESNAESISSAAESRERKATAKADNGKKAAKTGNTKQESRETVTSDETAPAEGLELVELADGLAVTGNSRTTYKHRRDIKAHGCTWNKTAQQWEAHSAEDCETLRRWFALRDQTTATTQDEPTANEPTDTNERADTLHEAEDITDGEADTTATASETAREVSPLLEAVADLLRTFADIMQQAKQWEGVTIPAATLARWKQEAEDGTKTAAARLCEVCACLASLTPDSRKEFDALGVIFWTLSEQIRNGYSPENLQGATDYARAQLFDLIDRTQNANQARAVREANRETSESKAEALSSFAESGTRKPTGNSEGDEQRRAA